MGFGVDDLYSLLGQLGPRQVSGFADDCTVQAPWHVPTAPKITQN